MNTVTKTIFSPEQLDELRKRVLDYKEQTPASWYEIHQTTGIGESTIQAFALGTYKGNNQNVATEVEKWFKNAETMEFFSDMSVVPAYQPTPTALNIRANLLYAKRGNFNTIQGNPGVGKSEALDHFVWEFQNVWRVTASPSRSTFNAIMLAILNAFNVPPGNRTSHQLSELVRRQFRSRTDALLIVDEFST
ncbi:hypothetical protein MMA231_00942 [Asticcacaulis sp. MM231]|uniref:AAA family ATPase n=1 Tax=Asticcacaulis sp. MM231 TaxID=3157666 RepID=UPI0032D578C7